MVVLRNTSEGSWPYGQFSRRSVVFSPTIFPFTDLLNRRCMANPWPGWIVPLYQSCVTHVNFRFMERLAHQMSALPIVYN